MPTASEVFTEINTRLQGDPSKVQGMNAVYAFDLAEDEDGGKYGAACMADGFQDADFATAFEHCEGDGVGDNDQAGDHG